MRSTPAEEGSQQAAEAPIYERLKVRLMQEVDKRWVDVPLILSCALTGLIDSSVYNVYTCFVSMQTGNTVYVGLSVSGQPIRSPYRGIKSLNAILCFCLGILFFGRLSQNMAHLSRGSMSLSWVLQAAIIFISAALIQSNVVPPGAGSDNIPFSIVLLPLGLLSFQSAGQIVQSRILELNEVPTIVLTSTYCDLMLDPHLFTDGIRENPKRNRRVLSIIALIGGAIAGGFLTKGMNITNALWIAGAAKVAFGVMWLFWKSLSSIRLE